MVIPLPSWKDIKEIPWENIRLALQRLADRKPINLVLCLILLLASIALGFWYWHRSSYYESLINNTLRAELEPTSQNYPGLEAFLLSNLTFEEHKDSDNDGASRQKDFPKLLGQAKFSVDFLRKWDDFQRELHKFVQKHEGKPADSSTQGPTPGSTQGPTPGSTQRRTSGTEESVNLSIAKGENDGLILKDNTKPGFLFLPVYVLRPSFSLAEIRSLSATDEQDEGRLTILKKINDAINGDKDLKEDVLLTAALAGSLDQITNTPVIQVQQDNGDLNFVESRPAQVYIITKNGLNRIFSKRHDDLESYYGNQFTATTFFPSRPYFWPVFQRDKNKVGEELKVETVGDFFYVTRPYMDLGGNGFVMTLSRGIQIGGITQAVVCFDLAFAPTKSVDRSLSDLVHTFNGTVIYADCDVDTGKCQEESDRGDVKAAYEIKSSLMQNVQTYIDANRVPHERSILGGSIRVINSKKDTNEIQISVPTEGPSRGDSRTVKLLLLSLNLTEYKRITTWIAAVGCLTFGGMLLMLTFWLASMARVRKEYEGAFRRVAKVMYKSPTPYVRLDAQDRIRDCSLSFCERLGYPCKRASVEKMKRFTFKELVFDDDIEIYDDVQERRLNRKEVNPYTIRMKRADGSPVSVVVISADVPSAEFKTLPETFGILLDEEEYSAHGTPPEGQDGRAKRGPNVISLPRH